MFGRIRILTALSFLLLASLSQDDGICAQKKKAKDPKPNTSEMRSWASQDGKYTVKARLMRFTPQGLNLQTEDGRSIHVPIGKLSTEDQRYARGAFRESDDRLMLGFYFGHIRDLRKAFKKIMPATPPPAMRKGVFVGGVVHGGPAHKAGMKALDVVTHIDGRVVDDPDHLTDIMMGMELGSSYTVRLRRFTQTNGKIIWPSESLDLMPIPGAEHRKLEQAEELAKAKECPLKIIGGLLKDNIIGKPELSLKLENLRESDVVAYEIEAECYNSFGDEVRSFGRGSHVFRGIGQTAIPSGDSKTATWQLSLYDTTTNVTARVVRVKLDNGIEWKPDNANVQDVVVEMEK